MSNFEDEYYSSSSSGGDDDDDDSYDDDDQGHYKDEYGDFDVYAYRRNVGRPDDDIHLMYSKLTSTLQSVLGDANRAMKIRGVNDSVFDGEMVIQVKGLEEIDWNSLQRNVECVCKNATIGTINNRSDATTTLSISVPRNNDDGGGGGGAAHRNMWLVNDSSSNRIQCASSKKGRRRNRSPKIIVALRLAIVFSFVAFSIWFIHRWQQVPIDEKVSMISEWVTDFVQSRVSQAAAAATTTMGTHHDEQHRHW